MPLGMPPSRSLPWSCSPIVDKSNHIPEAERVTSGGDPVTTQLAAAARVRRFNRFYTRRIGLLDAGHLHTPFSLAEARVLYEVAHLDRPTASTLIATLGLDAGYLSRLLRGLRQRGLVTARPSADDRRQRHLALSARGR